MPFLADTDLTQEGLFLTQTKNIELNVSHKSRISDTMSTNTRPHRWSLSSGVITMNHALEVLAVTVLTILLLPTVAVLLTVMIVVVTQ